VVRASSTRAVLGYVKPSYHLLGVNWTGIRMQTTYI